MSKKIALCIGINHYNNADTLNGCINDVLLWRKTLKENFNFKVLPPILNRFAHFDNLKSNIIAFFKQLNEGDLGVIFFSGHGTRNPRDGVCYEAICVNNAWIEGETHLRPWIDEYKHPKAKLVFIADSCHSGTLIEQEICSAYAVYGSYKHHLKHQETIVQIDFDQPEIKKDFELFLKNKDFELDFEIKIDSVCNHIDKHHKNLKASIEEKILILNNSSKEVKEMLQQVTLKAKFIKSENSCVSHISKEGKVILNTKDEYEIMIAACRGHEYAYEYAFEEGSYGVFTRTAIQILKENSKISYNEFNNLIIEKMKHEKYRQTPLIQGNEQTKKQIIFKL